jgi:hypothetical protein
MKSETTAFTLLLTLWEQMVARLRNQGTNKIFYTQTAEYGNEQDVIEVKEFSTNWKNWRNTHISAKSFLDWQLYQVLQINWCLSDHLHL